MERVPENAARIEQQQLGKCFVIVRDRGSLVINKGSGPLRKFVSCLGYRLPTLADANGAQRLRNCFQAVRRCYVVWVAFHPVVSFARRISLTLRKTRNSRRRCACLSSEFCVQDFHKYLKLFFRLKRKRNWDAKNGRMKVAGFWRFYFSLFLTRWSPREFYPLPCDTRKYITLERSIETYSPTCFLPIVCHLPKSFAYLKLL